MSPAKTNAEARSHSAECLQEHEDAIDGVLGRCSVPMWMNGCPAGTCEHKAFGRVVPEPYYRNAWTGEERTITGRLRSYADRKSVV